MIFANVTAKDVWIENWCDKCHDPAQMERRLTGKGRGCMVLNSALTRVTPPEAIVKGRSGSLMASAFRCTEFMDRPALAVQRGPEPTGDEPSLFGDLL